MMCQSLVCVLQVVSEKEYKRWFVKRQEALAAIDNRETLVMETAVQLENNLSVLGTSARHSSLKLCYGHLCMRIILDFVSASSCRGDGH